MNIAGQMRYLCSQVRKNNLATEGALATIVRDFFSFRPSRLDPTNSLMGQGQRRTKSVVAWWGKELRRLAMGLLSEA
jgi:hypothetical protein